MSVIKRLILGCGPRWPRGEEPYQDTFLDIRQFGNVDVVHDLNVTPWPFEDNEFQSISAVHVIEHLQDLLSFMDECWRVLSPGGTLYLETPHAGMDVGLTHSDPTHIRCYTLHTFINYFSPEGTATFQYTDKAWSMPVLKIVNNCIVFHGQPVKS